MQLFRLIFLFLLCPIITLAQNGVITGKVIQADTKAPVKANVFLANSSFGTATLGDGTFALNGLKPGQYTLVVNALGYQDYTETVLVNGKPINLNIELSHKVIQLKEVNISTLSKSDWKLYYEQFKNEFLGTDKNADDCKILNPEIVNISYHKSKKELDVTTDDFLIIENRALGYRVKFLIEEFKNDEIASLTTSIGQPLFEELTGSKSQMKRWAKNRAAAYYGSSMHFYRSLYKDSLAAEGFDVYHLTRQPNPELSVARPEPSRYRIVNEIDLRPMYINQVLSKQWQRDDILSITDKPGLYAVNFPDCLYVVYKKGREDIYFKDVYHPPGIPNYPITIVSLTDNAKFIIFDSNGVVVGDENPLYEGEWATHRLSQLLPVDYELGK